MKKYILIIILILLYLIIITFYKTHIDQLFFNSNIINNNIINLSDNQGHLGDQIYLTYYFNLIKDYLIENNIIIKYYVNSDYHCQMLEFIDTTNIKLYDYKPIGLNMSLCSYNHLNNHIMFYHIVSKIYNKKLNYDWFYINFFNYISDRIKIPVKMTKFEYKNINLLKRYNNLLEKYKNIDILIINSIPRGDQYYIDIEKWNNYIIKLQQENFKIVTTLKINNINCTIDDKLTIFDIAAISTHSKIIIAINTGPTSVLFNQDTLNYTRKIYLFDNNLTYSYKNLVNIDNIEDININELHNMVNK